MRAVNTVLSDVSTIARHEHIRNSTSVFSSLSSVKLWIASSFFVFSRRSLRAKIFIDISLRIAYTSTRRLIQAGFPCRFGLLFSETSAEAFSINPFRGCYHKRVDCPYRDWLVLLHSPPGVHPGGDFNSNTCSWILLPLCILSTILILGVLGYIPYMAHI